MPKTYVYTAPGGPENEQFIESPKPVPGEGQILVKVHAAGVNPADWKQRANVQNAPDPLAAPTPMGREVSGVVEEIGAGVEGFAIGDEVFGSVAANGAFSEYSVLPIKIAAHKPNNVSFFDAATIPTAAATAYDGIQQLKLGVDDTLLIIGIGGGVGIVAAQLAIAQGVKVIGTASAAKAELVHSIGATHVVYGDGVVDRLRSAAPNGIDALFDTVGGNALREAANLAVNPSKIISSADQAAAVELGGARLERARNAAVLEAIVTMLAEGKLKPFVTEVFPLERVRDALELVESGHATGKVVLEIS